MEWLVLALFSENRAGLGAKRASKKSPHSSVIIQDLPVIYYIALTIGMVVSLSTQLIHSLIKKQKDEFDS